MTLITQITPAYPPVVSGVGDYAAALAHAGLFQHEKFHTITMARNEHNVDDENILTLYDQTPTALSDALNSIGTTCVVLHFSGYGYARWGLCSWLVKGLQAWKHGCDGRRLVTLFHEVYTSGPIWKSSYWTSGLQRRIAYQLGCMSDSAIVTSEGGYRQITALCPDLPLELVPVFSNVGEINVFRTFAERYPIAIVFGSPGSRERAYIGATEQEAHLSMGFDRMGIAEVVDIGPKEVGPSKLAGRPIRRLGALPTAEVSDWLQNACIGMLAYPAHVVSKSGVAAAYFSHGLLVVNVSSECMNSVQLGFVDQFVSPLQFGLGQLADESVAQSGWTWYQPHRFERVAQIISTLMSALS